MLECYVFLTAFAHNICLHGYILFIYLIQIQNTKICTAYRTNQPKIQRYEFLPSPKIQYVWHTADFFPNGLQSFKTNDCFCGYISFWLFFCCFIRDRRDETENDRSVRDGTRKAPCDPGCKLGSLIFLYHFNISITLSSPVQIYLHAI